MKKDTFDEMITKGKLTDAARFFAKEYYNSGKMGHTRKLLIEQLANKVDSLEKAWIPVSERLPKCDKRYGDVNVLVCMDDEFISSATYDKNNGWELWADAGEVTHWMPLPEPPKESDTDGKGL